MSQQNFDLSEEQLFDIDHDLTDIFDGTPDWDQTAYEIFTENLEIANDLDDFLTKSSSVEASQADTTNVSGKPDNSLLSASDVSSPSQLLALEASQADNGNVSGSSLLSAPDVPSPSHILSPVATIVAQDLLVDTNIPSDEQAKLQPAMLPGADAFVPMQDTYDFSCYDGQFSINDSYSMPPSYQQAPVTAFPAIVPAYDDPFGEYGPFAGQVNDAVDAPGEFVNNLEPQPNNTGGALPDVTSYDVAAEDNSNIEYVSAAGEIFKNSDVRYNPTHGYFIPLTQRKKDAVLKRQGSRPGTNEPLYDICKWERGPKTESSEALGLNVYGGDFDIPSEWDLPNGLGKIRYGKEGCLPDGFALTARQIRAYIDNNPRNLRLSIASPPSQAGHRLYAKECVWSCCPNPKRVMRQGFHQVVFDEFPEQTDIGDRDPFRIAGRMHLWCYEQCFDITEDFKRGIVKPEVRRLPRESRNVMALDRDHNDKVVRETYEPWFRHHIENNPAQLLAPRSFDQSLAHALTKHHLISQTGRRQLVRDGRNKAIKHDPKSIDVHEGDLELYQERDNSLSNAFFERSTLSRSHPLRPDDVFQPASNPVPYTLPSYFGNKADGSGFLLDKALIKCPKTRRGKKRNFAEASNEDGGSGDNDDDDGDARPKRAAKRPRTAVPNSPVDAPSPRHNYGTRGNSGVDLALPKSK